MFADFESVSAVDLSEATVFRDSDPAFVLVEIEVDNAVTERFEIVVRGLRSTLLVVCSRPDSRHLSVPKKPDERL